jgi:flagellar biosynthesis/type III secretory pathway chaperone
MLKIGMLLCTVSFAAINPLHAGEVIEVEKLSKGQLDAALKSASDDTLIKYQGQTETKAQWRSAFQAKRKSAMAKLKELEDERQARFESAAKALQDQQDRSIAEENAKVIKEFKELTSR